MESAPALSLFEHEFVDSFLWHVQKRDNTGADLTMLFKVIPAIHFNVIDKT
jgi:hypothetical protein